ncbi:MULTISPECIES: ABC transporter substrate-binding protein [Hyphomicrobiales]|jgi:4,5-dihydroxyphthalate decarboxylase|uniref:ABC transporter substrate-binding protein n=1 Tax=Hyphomicrobiales TaxID=356 RepID=UPI001FDAB258|nr:MULTISPECIES: ABC transporter substrate-binding protein [Hyphomicrobiales]MDX3804802.1 ABC transporter substrate-binding protein [Bosea sp. (in: a-proteobacteria)]
MILGKERGRWAAREGSLSKLRLSIAIGDYDRNRPLLDGEVQIDGVDPVFMKLVPEEIFFRAFRHAEFDVCEASLSSFTIKTAQGTNPYVGVPAFVSRAFRHTGIFIRNDRGIEKPQDLKGKRIGCPEYQLTACVWIRALLEDDYGVKPSDVTWVRGGIEQPGRAEKIQVSLPSDIRLEQAPADRSLNQMLANGEIDGFIGPRSPSSFEAGHPNVVRLFSDPTSAAADYYRRTKIFPIMHAIGARRTIVEEHPWLPAALLKAFEQSKRVALGRLSDTSATKITLPFVEEQLQSARALMGEDFWSYGVGPNLHVLDAFLKTHHSQGLSPRQLGIDELFHLPTLEAFKI